MSRQNVCIFFIFLQKYPIEICITDINLLWYLNEQCKLWIIGEEKGLKRVLKIMKIEKISISSIFGILKSAMSNINFVLIFLQKYQLGWPSDRYFNWFELIRSRLKIYTDIQVFGPGNEECRFFGWHYWRKGAETWSLLIQGMKTWSFGMVVNPMRIEMVKPLLLYILAVYRLTVHCKQNRQFWTISILYQVT